MTMSKYYKAEDVIAFLNLHCPKDMWEYQIADLPTIEVKGGDLEDAILLTKDAYSDLCLKASQVSDKAECDNCIWNVCNYNKIDWEVSEDCISRAWLWKNYQTVCENVICSECPFDSDDCRLADFMMNAPSVVPQVPNEDCISREYLLSKVYDMDNDNLVVDLKDIENAPRAVPSRAEGEWKLTLNDDYRCTACGLITSSYKANYCPNCGAKMKGTDTNCTE